MNRAPRKHVNFDFLSKCSAQYADAIADPFDCDEGACLPLQTLAETQKARVFVRTSFVTGTAAMGFVMVNPWTFGFNNQDSVWVSAAGYTGLSFAEIPSGIIATRSNAPFAALASASMRLVSIGIRVKNRTQVLNREGIVTGLCEPGHNDLNGFTVNNLGAFDQAFREVVDAGDATFSVKWDGVSRPEEQTFSATGTTIDGTTTYPCIGIAAEVTSAANPQVFDVLIVGHYEYAGSVTRGKTITWADPQGAAIVATASRRAAMHTTAESQDSKTWWDSFKETLREGTRMVLPVAPHAIRAAGAYAGGGLPAAAASVVSSFVGRSIAPRQQPKSKGMLLLKDKKKKK